jgi:hypothetical protein
VGAITGWTASKVKVSLHRARKHMLIILNKLLNKTSNNGTAKKK